MTPFILSSILYVYSFCHGNAANGASVPFQNPPSPSITSGLIATGPKEALANSKTLRLLCGKKPNFNASLAEKMAGRLFTELRSRALEAHFDATRFLAHSQKYKNQLEQITKKANETELHGDLGDRIRFYRHVLRVLIDSAVYTIRYNEPFCPAQYCIRQIIKVNLRLIMLYNACGKLDLCYPYHSQMLSQLREEVLMAERNMVGTNRSYAMQKVFVEQVLEAKRAMYGLRFQMPQD